MKSSDLERVFRVPSHVFASTHGTSTVVTKLYGPADANRVAKERKEGQYRAEQLAPIVKVERPERPDRGYRKSWSSNEDTFDMFEKFQARRA